MSEIYNSSHMAHLAMEQTFFSPDVHYIELKHLIRREFIDPGIYQVFLQVYRENPWRSMTGIGKNWHGYASSENCMPEGTQLIALTKTFASQILKDYPDSLGDTGFDSIEAYMDQLANADIFSRWRRCFINYVMEWNSIWKNRKIVSDCKRYTHFLSQTPG